MARNNSAQAAVTFSGGGAGNGTVNSAQVALTTAASSIALPLGPDGKVVRAVWLQTNAVVYFRLQVGAGSNATVNDVQLSPNNPIVVIVGPYTYLSGLSATGTALLNISGVEIG